MANNYTLFSAMLPVANDTEKEWLQLLIQQIEEERTDGPDGGFVHEYLDNYTNGLNFSCEFEAGSDRKATGLWIYSEECGIVDALCDFVQYFLKKFHPDKYWTIEWADTCSKPRVGEFGGGAAVITARGAKFINTGTWIMKTTKKMKQTELK